MANIEQNLNDIQNAVYGKDVRKAIHDSIEAINNDVHGFVRGELDTELTSTTLPAQGKAAGDMIRAVKNDLERPESGVWAQLQSMYETNAAQEEGINNLQMARYQLANSNSYIHSNFKPVYLQWMLGTLVTGDASYIQYGARCVTDFVSTADIDAIEIDLPTGYYYTIYYYLYDKDKNWLYASYTNTMHLGNSNGYQKFDGKYMASHDILAIPKHVPYVRIVAAPYTASNNTEVLSYDTMPYKTTINSIRGIVFDADKVRFDEENSIYKIPIIFGRGNVYSSDEVAAEDLTHNARRIRTPFIPTELIDGIIVDRLTTFNYTVALIYYNTTERDATSNQYVYTFYDGEAKAKGIPIIKEYKYVRICVSSGLADNSTDYTVFTPDTVMSDISFIREKNEPCFSTILENEKLHQENNCTEKYYPLVYRRKSDGVYDDYPSMDDRGMSRICTAGDSNNVEDLIPIDDFDFIINTTNAWMVYIARYDSTGHYIDSINFARGTRVIPSSKWITDSAAKIAVAVVQAEETNQLVLSKQDWYRYIHLCKKNAMDIDAIIQKESKNRNSVVGKPYEYFGLTWEYGRINSSGGDTISTARLRTGLIKAEDLHAVEIEQPDDVKYNLLVFRYTVNDTTGEIEYVPSTEFGDENHYLAYYWFYLDDVDMVAIPQGLPYVRLVLQPCDPAYTDKVELLSDISLHDALDHVRGIRTSFSEQINADENRVYVNCLFGRGNMFPDNKTGYGRFIHEKYDSQSGKNRFSTPFIETSKVDVIYNTEDYDVQIYYYDSTVSKFSAQKWYRSADEQYNLTTNAFPIYKQYNYFRLKVFLRNTETGCSPYDVMSDIKFFRYGTNLPTGPVAFANDAAASKLGMKELYPKYEYRKINTTTGADNDHDDIYAINGGCGYLSTPQYIDAKSVDMIVHTQAVTDPEDPIEQTYYLYVYKYNEGKEYIGNTRFARVKNITSDNWSTAAYIRLGFYPVSSLINWHNGFIDQQEMYNLVHIYAGLGGSEGSTDILDLNPKQEMLPKLEQLAKSFSGNSSIGPYDACVIKFLHFSDLHATAQSERALRRIMDFYNEYKDYVDTVIHTGDIVNNESNANILNTISDASGFYNVIGNHDIWDNPTGNETDSRERWHAHDEQWAYEKYIVPFMNAHEEDEDLHIVENKCYYYKDYKAIVNRTVKQSGKEVVVSEEKTVLRLIALDCMHMSDADMGGETCTQPTWFNDILQDTVELQTEQNRTIPVVVVSHVRMVNGENMTYLNTGFDNPATNRGGTNGYFPYFMDPSYLPIVRSFVEAGGVMACWLAGHVHADICGTWHCTTSNDKDCDILNMCVTTAGDINARHRTRDLRTFGTRLYDAFNIVGVDTAHNLVKVVRVGMNTNCVMGKVDTFCWNYVKCEVVSTS